MKKQNFWTCHNYKITNKIKWNGKFYKTQQHFFAIKDNLREGKVKIIYLCLYESDLNFTSHSIMQQALQNIP